MVSQSTSEELEEEPDKKRSRKRVRCENNWKRKKAKLLRDSGKEYVTLKGKKINGKSPHQFIHSCRFECKDFSEEERNTICSDFWELESWNLQTAFITGSMQLACPKRIKQDALSHKQTSVTLKLKDKRVCKLFFIKTLDISQKRYDNVLKKRRDSGVPSTDKRGKHIPSNKTPDDIIESVKQHINSFPKYSSHYSREKNPHTKYLSSDLNLKKMYELFVQSCNDKNIETPVKESYYRQIFNTKFNLSFKKPLSDTCNTCDQLNIKIKHGIDIEESKKTKELHLRKAEKARSCKNDALAEAKEDASVKAICFDLEKTLPNPVLTCNKIYYLRQLWSYNLNIHDLGSGQASMYMWDECQASRGSQEVGSCLLKFALNLPDTIKKLVAFSDNCGGQNKSKYIVRFWMYILQNTKLESIDHKFFIAGHSYNECDQDFGLIEKSKRNTQYIFVPDDWRQVVAKAHRKFQVVKMTSSDFVSVEKMNDSIKVSVVGISKFQWIHFEKNKPYILFYKNCLNEDLPFQQMDLRESKNAGRPSAKFTVTPLYESLLPITTKKYKDLQTLLQFLPPIYHDFYTNLPHAAKRKISGKKNNLTNGDKNETLSNDELDCFWESD